MAGKFELYTDSAGKFRFRLRAGNNEIIAVGEAYDSKTAAMSGIESIKHHAAEASVNDMTSDAPAQQHSAQKPAKPVKQPTSMAHH
jgi:hypothetical protein